MDTPTHNCPRCSSLVEYGSWSHVTHAEDGEPIEQMGTALFCTNALCLHSYSAVEEEELLADKS